MNSLMSSMEVAPTKKEKLQYWVQVDKTVLLLPQQLTTLPHVDSDVNYYLLFML